MKFFNLKNNLLMKELENIAQIINRLTTQHNNINAGPELVEFIEEPKNLEILFEKI